MLWSWKDGKLTGGLGAFKRGQFTALLHKAVLGGGSLCVVASAVSVLRFVPVLRVFPFACASVPLPSSFLLSSPLIAFLVFAIFAIPSLFSLWISPPS